jgi:hypothetical protein
MTASSPFTYIIENKTGSDFAENTVFAMNDLAFDKGD